MSDEHMLFFIYKIDDRSLNNSFLSSENVSQQRNISTEIYVGWKYKYFRKQKKSMLQV